jgi:peptide/nickel transport system substrate-binding protein
MISLNGANPIKGKFANVQSITVLSRHVLRIKLKWSDGDFLYNLGLGNAIIQSPKSWANNSQKPIGTGPYRFTEWKQGEYIKLVANYNYWGKLAKIKEITIVFTPTLSQVESYLADGLLDGYSSMIEVGFLDSLFSIRQDYVLKMGNTSGEIIVAMNHANEMLASKDFRRGITLAIDKKVITATPNFITGAEIGSHYSPSDNDYLDLTLAYPFSLFDAKQLIQKSGVVIKPLILLSPPPAYAQFISLHVQEMLKKVGLTVKIEEVSWKEWLTRVYQDKDYDLTVIAHTEPHDLDIYARDNYYFNYENNEYKKIINQLNRTHDQSQRSALLKEAQQKLSDDAVNIYLFMLPKVGVWHKALRGYWLNEPIPAMIFSQMYWQK